MLVLHGTSTPTWASAKESFVLQLTCASNQTDSKRLLIKINLLTLLEQQQEHFFQRFDKNTAVLSKS